MTRPATLQALELGGRLAEVSDARLLEVVALLDRLPERGVADKLVAGVRPRLARLRPPRPATLERIVALPFEDALVPQDELWPGRRRISRCTLRPLFKIVLDGLDPGLLAELRAETDGRDMRSSAGLALAVGGRLWPEAARLVGEALRGEAGKDRQLEAQLLGAEALLALAPVLVPVLWSLPPKPMAAVPPDAVAALAPVFAAARARSPETVLWTLELLLARSRTLEVVSALLRAPELGLGPREREAHARDLSRSRLEAMRRSVGRLRGAGAGDRSTAAAVDELIRLVDDLETPDDRWNASPVDKASLKDVRKAAAEVVSERLDQAVGGEILAAMDALARPDALADDEVERLEGLARAVHRLGVSGAQLGLTAAGAAAPRDVFQRFLGEYRAKLAARPAPGGRGPAAPPVPFEQVRLIEILFGPDTAMRLLEDVRAGAGAASPAPS